MSYIDFTRTGEDRTTEIDFSSTIFDLYGVDDTEITHDGDLRVTAEDGSTLVFGFEVEDGDAITAWAYYAEDAEGVAEDQGGDPINDDTDALALILGYVTDWSLNHTAD